MHGLQPDLGHALSLRIEREQCPDGVLAQLRPYVFQMDACTDARVKLNGRYINTFREPAIVDNHLWQPCAELRAVGAAGHTCDLAGQRCVIRPTQLVTEAERGTWLYSSRRPPVRDDVVVALERRRDFDQHYVPCPPVPIGHYPGRGSLMIENIDVLVGGEIAVTLGQSETS